MIPTSITSDSISLSEKSERYVRRTLGSLDGLVLKNKRRLLTITVELARIDQPHGNKYQASVTLSIGTEQLHASDSTLNVLAAVDIVRRKLALMLSGRSR